MLGCNPATRYRTLSFFFDGVPNPEAPDDSSADSLQQNLQADSTGADSTSKRPVWSFHPMLEQSECETCHKPSEGYRLLDAPEKVCLTCHDDKANAAYVHVPAQEGMCMECHNPHGTTDPPLLVMTGQELCFKCHDQESTKASETHAAIENTACYECHDAHAGESEYFLK